MTYEEIKFELTKKCSDITFFTKDFYDTFVEAKKMTLEAEARDEEVLYKKDGIWLNRCFDKVYESRFYKENSCAYCIFLEVYYWALSKYLVSLVLPDKGPKGNYYLERQIEVMSEEDAHEWAKVFSDAHNALSMTVTKCA